MVARDSRNRIMIDGRNRTSTEGLFAAGDVTDVIAEQVLISVGEGAKAALSAYEYLLQL
jgi:alkyl hydroperoxide reductase subunit F